LGQTHTGRRGGRSEHENAKREGAGVSDEVNDCVRENAPTPTPTFQSSIKVMGVGVGLRVSGMAAAEAGDGAPSHGIGARVSGGSEPLICCSDLTARRALVRIHGGGKVVGGLIGTNAHRREGRSEYENAEERSQAQETT
jgi:hypothetical protein